MEYQVAPPGGDKNTGPVQEAVGGLFLFTAFVLVSLRFYVRARMIKLWWDDFFLLLGLLISIAGFYLDIASIKSGFGRHVYYLSPKQIFYVLKLQIIALPVYMSSLMFTKISICLFLLRIFTTNRVWKRAMYIIIALIVVASLSSIILTFARCKPFVKAWDLTIKGTCWPAKTQIALFYYHSGVSIFTDFLLACLPLYFLKNIQISLRTKLSICALMSLGVFTGICAINRTAWTAQLYSNDFTYFRTNYVIWVGLEMTVAMIAAAIPALRPLWPKSAKSTTNRIRKSSGQLPRPNNKQRRNSTYVMMDQQIGAESLPSRPEACITAPQQGRKQVHVGSEATSPPDCNEIMKTSHISTETFRKCEEGQWIPEHSSFSHEERIVEDVV